jgi:uncharacterized protein (TIGR00255 family)
MTGFGRAEEIRETWSLRVEVKSLNHRFLEIIPRLPRRYQGLEERIRRTIRERFVRGRFEILVQVVGTPPGFQALSVNTELAAQYVTKLRLLKTILGLSGDIQVADLLRMRDVFTAVETEEDLEALWEELNPVLEKALSDLRRMREAEGAYLTQVLREQLGLLEGLVGRIEALKGEAFQTARRRLEERLKTLLANKGLDPLRLHQEIAILADKTDITEEIDRLRSHLRQFEKTFESPGPHGRKLDFLLQEMFREINTLSNKAGMAEISQLAVEAKCTLEKMREQVQNIE